MPKFNPVTLDLEAGPSMPSGTLTVYPTANEPACVDPRVMQQFFETRHFVIDREALRQRLDRLLYYSYSPSQADWRTLWLTDDDTGNPW